MSHFCVYEDVSTFPHLITRARAAQRGEAEEDDGNPAAEVRHDDEGHSSGHGRVILGLAGPDGAPRSLGDEEHP